MQTLFESAMEVDLGRARLTLTGGCVTLQVVQWAAHYEHRLQEGSKAIFHIEAFVAKIMSVYKTWSMTAFG